MRTKALKILSIIACGYIFLLGFPKISVQLPNYLVLSKLSLLEIRYIPMATAATHIMLSVFVLIKLFVKQTAIVRITGTLFGLSGVFLLLSINSYLSQTVFPVISRIKYFSFRECMVVFENFVLLLCGLLAILICVNTFKSFVSNKSAFIIALAVIGLALIPVILQNATMSTELFKSIRYLINFVIIVIMKHPALFLLYYIALKPTLAEKSLQPKSFETNEQKKKSNRVVPSNNCKYDREQVLSISNLFLKSATSTTGRR